MIGSQHCLLPFDNRFLPVSKIRARNERLAAALLHRAKEFVPSLYRHSGKAFILGTFGNVFSVTYEEQEGIESSVPIFGRHLNVQNKGRAFSCISGKRVRQPPTLRLVHVRLGKLLLSDG